MQNNPKIRKTEQMRHCDNDGLHLQREDFERNRQEEASRSIDCVAETLENKIHQVKRSSPKSLPHEFPDAHRLLEIDFMKF